jgi:O-acetyl-ADP-ribose deacetylase (regulator of RNase III)/uncharacterized protein YwgA
MIHYTKGNLLESKAEALVNTVNTVGVMGKGIALQFKKMFPQNFKLYAQACKNNSLSISQLLVTEEASLLTGKKIIINFPTKTHWQLPSAYEYIEVGLTEHIHLIQTKNIRSVAIPPLGAGNGVLRWDKVKLILEKHLSDLACDIYVFEPTTEINEAANKNDVKLTPARAMLLAVQYDLVRNGEFVSEFAAEKVAYFLQRFGTKDAFQLDFRPNFYGPYSGKVKHVLYYLNVKYLVGYGTKDKKPFEEVYLIPDTETEIMHFLDKPENTRYKMITEKTKSFLDGFYSPFGLELLSTIDYIITDKKAHTEEAIIKELESWSNRKSTLFTNQKFIHIALNNLHLHLS